MNQALPNTMPPGSGAPDLPLRDIHLPDPVGFWPLAPGWWVLLVIVVLACLALALYVRQKRLTTAYRREALVALEQLTQSYKSQEIDHFKNESQSIVLKRDFIEGINTLLKRTALTAYPTATHLNIAALSGEQWAHFLYMQCPALKKHSLTQQEFANLLASKYQRAPAELASVSLETLQETARCWICHHVSLKASNTQNSAASNASLAAAGGH